MESVTFVTEPLLHPDFVQFRVVAPLLSKLRGTWEPTLAAPFLSEAVIGALEERGIRALSGGAWFPRLRNSRDEAPSYVLSWARDALLGWNRNCIDGLLGGSDAIRVNFSMTSAFDADCWYVQSRPLEPALAALRKGVDWNARLALSVVSPFVNQLDKWHSQQMARCAGRVYTSSTHVAQWFRSQGVPVDGVFPVYYSPAMRPSTTSPSRDYVLCYLAKETDGAGLTALLRTGLPIRLFGAKTASWVSGVLRHHPFPNAQVLGRVSEEKLRDLYTNALVTAFPFTEESFGLVPVESMACGTPVLTYRAQGPGETVLDGRTGWLVRTPEELAECASRIFRDGYGGEMVRACLARSAEFSLDAAYSHWDQLLSSIASGRVVPASPSASPQRDARSRALTLPAGRGQRVEGQRFATGSVKPPYNSS